LKGEVFPFASLLSPLLFLPSSSIRGDQGAQVVVKEFIEMHDGKNFLSREILASTGFPDKMK
jgi:hypothetical protein